MIAYHAAGLEEFPIAARLRREMGIDMGSDLDSLGGDWQSKFCAYFETKQREGSGQLYLALDRELPIGMTIVSLRDEWRTFCFDMRFAFVNAVYVKAAYRRRGIGRELMLRAVQWAKDKGCARIRLRTSEDGRALYESVGFHAGREMEQEL